MPFNLGFGEVLIVLIVALLVFGGRLPEVARSLGQGVLQFKEGLKAGPDEDEEEEDDFGEDEDPDEAKPSPEPRDQDS